MSESVKDRPADKEPMTKAEKRAAARAARAKAERSRKRRQAVLGIIGGVAVIAIIGGVFVLVGQGYEKDFMPEAAPTATKPAAPPTDPADNQPFPQLPPGADPALGTKPGVSKGSGKLDKLTVTPLIKGTGPAIQAGQQVTANYVGVSYTTGEEFDSSWMREEPIKAQIGVGRVIKGWDQGLIGVTVGSRVQLDIPASLAYGDKAAGGAPSGPLRFVVDVLAAQ